MDPNQSSNDYFLNMLKDPALKNSVDNFEFKYVSKEFMQMMIEKVQRDRLQKMRSSAYMNSVWFDNNKKRKMSDIAILPGNDKKSIKNVKPITSAAAKQHKDSFEINEHQKPSKLRVMSDDQIEALVHQAVNEVHLKNSLENKIKLSSHGNKEFHAKLPQQKVEENNKLEDHIPKSPTSSGTTVESVSCTGSFVSESESISSIENVRHIKVETVDIYKVNENEGDTNFSAKPNNSTYLKNESTPNSNRSEFTEVDNNQPISPDDSFSDSLSVKSNIFPKENWCSDTLKPSEPTLTSVDREELGKTLGINTNLVNSKNEVRNEKDENIDSFWTLEDDPECDMIPVIPYPQSPISYESLRLDLEDLKSNDTWSMVNHDSVEVTRPKVTITTQTYVSPPISNHLSKKNSRVSRSVEDSPVLQSPRKKSESKTNQNPAKTKQTMLNQDERKITLTKIRDHQNRVLEIIKEIRRDLMYSATSVTKAERLKLEALNYEFANRFQKTYIYQLRKMVIEIRDISAHQFYVPTSNTPLIKLCTVYSYLSLAFETYGKEIKCYFAVLYPRKLESLVKLAAEITLTSIEKSVCSLKDSFVRGFLGKCEDMVGFLDTQKDIKHESSNEEFQPILCRMEKMLQINKLFMYQSPKKLLKKNIRKSQVEQPKTEKRITHTLKNSVKTDLKKSNKQNTIKNIAKNVDQKKEPECKLKVSKNVNKKALKSVDQKKRQKCELKSSKNVNKKDAKNVDTVDKKKIKLKADKRDGPKQTKPAIISDNRHDQSSHRQRDVGAYVLPRSDYINSRESSQEILVNVPEQNELKVIFERTRKPKELFELRPKDVIHKHIKPFLPNLVNLLAGNATPVDLEILLNALKDATNQMTKVPSTGNEETFEQKDNVLETRDDSNHSAKQEEQQVGVHAVSTEVQLGLSQSKQRGEALWNRRQSLPLREDNDVFYASSTPLKLQSYPVIVQPANAAKDHSKEDEDGARALPPFSNPKTQQQQVHYNSKVQFTFVDSKQNLKIEQNTNNPQIKLNPNRPPHNIGNKKMNETVSTLTSSNVTADMDLSNILQQRKRYLIKLARNPLYVNRIHSEPWKLITRLANDLLNDLIISAMKNINSGRDYFVRDFLKTELE